MASTNGTSRSQTGRLPAHPRQPSFLYLNPAMPRKPAHCAISRWHETDFCSALMTDHFTGTDLTCLRGGRQVFEGLSFGLESGDALILRGPNGSGKSSLLRLMAGLGAPAAGNICWNDEAIGEDRLLHGERTHYLGHENAVKPALTVRENLAVWARLRSDTPAVDDAIDQALAAVDLQRLAGLPARLLSSGETRRLALARLVASDAPLWLLDEPTVGLDQASVERLSELLSAHRQAGGMVAMSIHGPFAAENSRTLDLGTRGGTS